MCRRPCAIGAVKTRDLRGVLMRRLWPLLFLLLVSPAVADALDCAVIKSTDWTTTEHGKDPLAVPMRQQVTRNADGAVVSDINTSVSFDGAVNVEVGGCTYPLTKIIEVSHGTARGIAGGNRVERWYSRDLKASLYARTEDSGGSIVETRAREISTSFKPVE
jgi:hypothetical protein